MNKIAKLLLLTNLYEDCIYNFLKQAAEYDKFRAKIEEISKKNKKPFSHWFPNGNRVYLDFSAEENFDKYDNLVINYLKEQGYDVDWISGYAEKDNRKFRIGKLLDSLKRKSQDNSIDFDDFKDIFENSEARKSGTKKLKIVISQDPHDIAQMSTDRGWTSCMNLVDGANKSSVYCEVESGGLIAYLIDENDLEIKKPLARVLIRRYANKKGKSYAVMEEQVYGDPPPSFTKIVQQWLDNRQSPTRGMYTMRGGWYSDSLEKEILPNPENINKEVEFFVRSGKEYPFILLKNVLENKNNFSEEALKKAELQAFGDWRHVNNLLSGHPFKWDNFPILLSNYLVENPEKIDSMINKISSSLSIGNFIDKIRKINVDLADIMAEKLNQKINLNLSEVNEKNKQSKKIDKYTQYGIESELRVKLEIAPASRLLETAQEVLSYASEMLDERALRNLINTTTHVFYMRDVINQRVISFIKPYIELLWEQRPHQAFYDTMHFLHRAKGQATFILPKLYELLQSKDFPEGSKKQKELKAIIEGIEENKHVSLNV